MLVALGHPNRLPILIALESEPRTISELVEVTGVGREPVKHAIKILTAARLVSTVEPPRVAANLVSFRYGTRLRGWASILEAVRRVVESDASEKSVGR